MPPGRSGPEAERDPFWQGRRVLVTGHSGFIGGWLSLWLHLSGAEVHGYALSPPTEPSFHDAVGLGRMFPATIADIRDQARLIEAVRRAAPEVVLHLAAQPLVGQAFDAPIETLDVNVVGTAKLLQAVRDHAPDCRAAIVLTSDKVYANRDDGARFVETDALGANEVYGASKAAAELVTMAFWRSYFARRQGFALTTVRAGNAVGGGDWAALRIVPDAMRAFAAGQPLELRNPASTRPWQHVLEIVGGMLLLARRLLHQPELGRDGWNFGPAAGDAQDVATVATALAAAWSEGATWRRLGNSGGGFTESKLLAIDSARAQRELGWRPVWSFDEMIGETVEWYAAYYRGDDCLAMSRKQIGEYRARCGWPAGQAT